MSITWVDNVTPLNAANMSQLEQTSRKGAANGYLGLDASGNIAHNGGIDANTIQLTPPAGVHYGYGYYPADRQVGSRIFSAAQQGDAQPFFVIDQNAAFSWGPGGAVGPDTGLYRASANLLQTGNFKADGDLYATADAIVRQGNTDGQITLSANGIYFGTALDTRLYRHAPGMLRTAGTLLADLHVYVDANTDGNGRLYFTGNEDTYMFREAAGTLASNSNLNLDGEIRINKGTANETRIGWAVAGPGLWFGPYTGDTNLYRPSAGALKTDGGLQAARLHTQIGTANEIAIQDNGNIYFGSASDTNLFRAAANHLRTSSYFSAASGIVLLPSANGVILTGGLGAAKGGSLGSIKVTIDGTDRWIPYYA